MPDADLGQPGPCPIPQHSLSDVYLALLGPEGVSGPGRGAPCNPQACEGPCEAVFRWAL